MWANRNRDPSHIFLVRIPLCRLGRLIPFGLYLVQIAVLLVECQTEIEHLEAAVNAAPHHVARLQVGVDKAGGVKSTNGPGPEMNIDIIRNPFCRLPFLREYVLGKFLNDPRRQPGAVVLEDELPNIGIQKLHDLDVEASMHESAETAHCKCKFQTTPLLSL